MIAGVIRNWYHSFPGDGASAREWRFGLIALWAFMFENMFFPTGQQEYGILEVASWFRGQPYAEPELLSLRRGPDRPAHRRHRGRVVRVADRAVGVSGVGHRGVRAAAGAGPDHGRLAVDGDAGRRRLRALPLPDLAGTDLHHLPAQRRALLAAAGGPCGRRGVSGPAGAGRPGDRRRARCDAGRLRLDVAADHRLRHADRPGPAQHRRDAGRLRARGRAAHGAGRLDVDLDRRPGVARELGGCHLVGIPERRTGHSATAAQLSRTVFAAEPLRDARRACGGLARRRRRRRRRVPADDARAAGAGAAGARRSGRLREDHLGPAAVRGQ